MHIRILTITHKLPAWVRDGYKEYHQRVRPHCKFELIEIAAEKRSAKSNINAVVKREGDKMLEKIDPQDLVIALEIKGNTWSTETLAHHIENWQQQGRDINFLIGGADGLSAACLDRANEKWSLSALTFPHALVRIILVEQLYRAFSILKHHPYHR